MDIRRTWQEACLRQAVGALHFNLESLEDRWMLSVPNAPSNLTAAAVSSSQVQLNWTVNSTDDTNMIVQENNGGTVTDFTLPAHTPSFLAEGLSPNTCYTWDVEACNSSGTSSPTSSVATATQNLTQAAYYNFAVPLNSTYNTTWSTGGSLPSIQTAPSGSAVAGVSYLGNFGGSTALTLNLSSLPSHKQLTVSFDLYLMDDWGNTQADQWKLSADNGSGTYTTLLDADFANSDSGICHPQTYPSGYDVAAATGGMAENINNSGTSDTVYHLTYTFPHDASSVTIKFEAPSSLSSGATWGVTNVSVSTLTPTDQMDGDSSLGDNSISLGGEVSSDAQNNTITDAISWTDGGLAGTDNYAGQGTILDEDAYLLQAGPNSIVAVNGTGTTWFDQTSEAGINPATYAGRFGDLDTLSYDSTSSTHTGFVLTDINGNTYTYYDFSPSLAANLRGRIYSFTNPAGVVTSYSYDATDDHLQTISRTENKKYNSSCTCSFAETFSYAYYASGADAGCLCTVTLARSSCLFVTSTPTSYSNYVAPQTVSSELLTYYDGSSSGPDSTAYGSAGQLQSVTVCYENAQNTLNAVDTTYLSYYTSVNVGSDPAASEGKLQFVLDPDSYARLKAAGSGLDPLSDCVSSTCLAAYAQETFTYDSAGRVATAVVQGAGSSSSATGSSSSSSTNGQGTYTYAYTANALADGSDFNDYQLSQSVTQAFAGTCLVETVYYNDALQPIADVCYDTQSGATWDTFYTYDTEGRNIQVALPSAVEGICTAFSDLGQSDELNATGEIQTTEYYSSTSATSTTAGGVAGWVEETFLQQGIYGTPIAQDCTTYFEFTATGDQPLVEVAADTTFGTDSGTDPRTTHYCYGFVSGSLQLAWVKAQLPPITASQNGPATSTSDLSDADTTTDYLDAYGRVIFHVHDDGAIDQTEYDALGNVCYSEEDIDTSYPPIDLPSGLTSTSTSPLCLTMTTTDSRGLVTKTDDANDGIVDYTVVNPGYSVSEGGSVVGQVVDEVRSYPGWHSIGGGHYNTTGPITITREFRPASGGQIYQETLTIAYSDADSPFTSSSPDGSETFTAANIRGLSRDFYNVSGQLVESDQFFSIKDLTYSMASAHIGGTSSNDSSTGNYCATFYGYDDMGNQSRVVDPTGTITRTVYDSVGQVVGTWIGDGTDDTVASGTYWSPSNAGNMVETESFLYDGYSNGTYYGSAGGGDGNMTRDTRYMNSYGPNQITEYYYDWRDRQVAAKSGVRVYTSGACASQEDTSLENSTEGTSGGTLPITYYTYDNADEVTETRVFDGTGINESDFLPCDGGPIAPASCLLRSETFDYYDDQGRVYCTRQAYVNPSTGCICSSFNSASQTFYDHDGNLMAQSDPTGTVTKYKYDNADRVVKTYVTDGAGDTVASGASGDWAEAACISNDHVLTQSEDYYYGDELALEIERDRYDTDTTTTGDLCGTSNARVTYTTYYYDDAGRQIETADIGTLGYAYSMSCYHASGSCIPSGSLVSCTSYDDAGNVSTTTDPRGIVTKMLYDMLGRETATIQAWDGGGNLPVQYAGGSNATFSGGSTTLCFGSSPDADTDVVNVQTYDGDGDVLTSEACQSWYTGGGTDQITANVYGSSTSDSDGFDANDVLVETQLPDKTTGAPSTSTDEEQFFNYGAPGLLSLTTDQDGSSLGYDYNALGQNYEQDAAPASGVDSTVETKCFTYDALGRQVLATSAGSSTVNQTCMVYDGLGNLIDDYQADSGSVSGSSPHTQYCYAYACTCLSQGMRLCLMTTPGGQSLYYGYDGDSLDNRIDRPDYIADYASGTVGQTLETYSYLGFGTIVGQSRPQISASLVYTGGSGGDDQYHQLDRFGRVLEQKWTLGGSGTVDDFCYGYDADGNILYKANGVDSSLSELFHASGSGNGYDNLNRETGFVRGTLCSSVMGGTLDSSAGPGITYTYDQQGNRVTTTAGGSTTDLCINQQDQYTCQCIGGVCTAFAYDADGNLTQDITGDQMVHDAWNRLVEVKDASGTELEAFTYDANDDLVSRTLYSGGVAGTPTYFYLDANGNTIEEQQSGATTYRYVWGLAGANELVLRDDCTGGGSPTRLYAFGDLMGSVTSLVDASSSTVVQRFLYTPFTKAADVRQADYSCYTGTVPYNWVYQLGAKLYDPTTGFTQSESSSWLDPYTDRLLQVVPKRDPNPGLEGIPSRAPLPDLNSITPPKKKVDIKPILVAFDGTRNIPAKKDNLYKFSASWKDQSVAHYIPGIGSKWIGDSQQALTNRDPGYIAAIHAGGQAAIDFVNKEMAGAGIDDDAYAKVQEAVTQLETACSDGTQNPEEPINLAGSSRGCYKAVKVDVLVATNAMSRDESLSGVDFHSTINWVGLLNPVFQLFTLKKDCWPCKLPPGVNYMYEALDGQPFAADGIVTETPVHASDNTRVLDPTRNGRVDHHNMGSNADVLESMEDNAIQQCLFVDKTQIDEAVHVSLSNDRNC
jgi:YD repeat-containing protein